MDDVRRDELGSRQARLAPKVSAWLSKVFVKDRSAILLMRNNGAGECLERRRILRSAPDYLRIREPTRVLVDTAYNAVVELKISCTGTPTCNCSHNASAALVLYWSTSLVCYTQSGFCMDQHGVGDLPLCNGKEDGTGCRRGTCAGSDLPSTTLHCTWSESFPPLFL